MAVFSQRYLSPSTRKGIVYRTQREKRLTTLRVLQTRCLASSRSLKWRFCLREIDALLGPRICRMGRIRGRSPRALQPGVGFRISVRDNLDSHRVPAIGDGTGGWTLRCYVEQSGPSEGSDGRPVRIGIRQGHAGIVCHISADVKWQPDNIRHRHPIGEPIPHCPNLTPRGVRCNGCEQSSAGSFTGGLRQATR